MIDTIRITVVDTKGSTPREIGTSMTVTASDQIGTIGGGALEWDATRQAREMLFNGATKQERTIPLGPDLGQCCGGSVRLRFEAAAASKSRATHPLWIWGAGHVGRAIVSVLLPLQQFDITWVDTGPARFPDYDDPNLSKLVAKEPPLVVTHAPLQAQHLILTYSHDIDLALCDGLLGHGFASAGLIGSATKWARFQKRLVHAGHNPDEISRIICPIGDPALGKHPQAIALGVAATLLRLTAPMGTAPRGTDAT